MKQLTILNPKKKDGGIYRCYLDKEDNIQYPPMTIKNCLKQLSTISNRQHYRTYKLPTLKPLDSGDIKKLQEKMSKNKAISRDCISDTFLKQTKNTDLLKEIWNNNILDQNIYLCEARIIPLNQVYPNKPNENQFRPIVVLSSLYKFMELRFLDKLNKYNKENLSQYQSTQVNIEKIINIINAHNKEDKMNLIFIDFRSAYNTINRPNLYQILPNRHVLEDDEINFLEALHRNVHYQDPVAKKEKYCYENGVVQGSPISPPLFNIYLDQFLEELKIKSLQQSIKGYPIVKQYCYLGIDIESNGKIKQQVTKMQTRIKKLTNKLIWICGEMNMRQKISIWHLFINSIIRYSELEVQYNQFRGVKKEFREAQRQSFKSILGMPKCFKDEIVDQLIMAKFKNQISNNIALLFNNQWKKCPLHNVLDSYEHLVLEHIKIDPKELMERIIAKIKDRSFKKHIGVEIQKIEKMKFLAQRKN